MCPDELSGPDSRQKGAKLSAAPLPAPLTRDHPFGCRQIAKLLDEMNCLEPLTGHHQKLVAVAEPQRGYVIPIGIRRIDNLANLTKPIDPQLTSGKTTEVASFGDLL